MNVTALMEAAGQAPARMTADEAIDALERWLVTTFEGDDLPLYHSFTDGVYARTFHMPAGCIVTSKIHKQRHHYIVTSGEVSVWIDKVGWQRIIGPYMGVTEAGTRRVLMVHTDTVWTTFHPNPTNETHIPTVEAMITDVREDHLVGTSTPVDRKAFGEMRRSMNLLTSSQGEKHE